jgi:hypothetical protein
LSLHTEFEILTWGRESSRQVQDLASKVGGGEQQRSCSSGTYFFSFAALRDEKWKKFSVQ